MDSGSVSNVGSHNAAVVESWGGRRSTTHENTVVDMVLTCDAHAAPRLNR